MKLTQLTKAVILLLVLQSSINYISAQSKKEVQEELDAVLIKQSELLTKNKELNALLNDYSIFYSKIKKELLSNQNQEEPVQQGTLSITESIQKLKNNSLSLSLVRDSLELALKKSKEEITRLTIQNEVVRNYLLGDAEEASFPSLESEFEGNWNLYLRPIQMVGKPFESGFISTNPLLMNDSISANYLYKIEFGEDEIATLSFKSGETKKVFYTINNFSVNAPYDIVFTKQSEFKLVAYISPMPNGLEISYEVPLKTDKVIYYYGTIKR